MKTIDQAFDYLVKTWETFPNLPKGFRTKYYLFKYKHLNSTLKVGIGKKIEMLEKAGFEVICKEKIYVKKDPQTQEQVIRDIFQNWDDYEAKHKKEDEQYLKQFIRENNIESFSEYRRKKIIERGGYKQIYIKK